MKLAILAAFVFAGAAAAQPTNPIQYVTTTPSGACGSNSVRLLTPDGVFYTCQDGSWAAATGGGGGGANALGYYLVQRSADAPVNAFNLGALTGGLLKISVSGAVATPATAVAGQDYAGLVTPEQFGATHDCSQDDGPAIQNASNSLMTAGVCSSQETCTLTFAPTLGSECYLVKTAVDGPLTIAGSFVTWQGAGIRTTIVKDTSNTTDTLQITGTSPNCGGGGMFNAVNGISFERSTPSSVTAGKGINITNGCWSTLMNDEAWDSVSDFYLLTSGNTNIIHSQAVSSWNVSGVNDIGFDLDSSGGTGNASTTLRDDVAAGSGGTSFGIDIHGSCIDDFLSDNFNSTMTTGILVNVTGSPTGNCAGDVHLNNSILYNGSTGISINNVNSTNATYPSVIVDGGTINGATLGVDIESSNGVSVNNIQFEQSGNTAIKVNGSNHNIVKGNVIEGALNGVYLLNSSNNVITANSCTGCTNSEILDSNSNNNQAYPNDFGSITDNGSGNIKGLPSGTITTTIASGTASLGTSSISSTGCATVVTVSASGVAATDSIIWNPNASIKAVTGYTPATTGGLTIAAYPTSGNVNFDVCNWSSGPITPGAVTLNWRVVR